ncbi:transporter substrate-binding domain-containing protein [Microbacterium lacus]|uniref:transporter substrate-binding domain-containing protein n=1 Tax=Microbacterium lacus TaxID=415217 RepID=UPI0012FD43CC|nr:transporter substrate-binding domain-containing protein [Microbacterium lacus]
MIRQLPSRVLSTRRRNIPAIIGGTLGVAVLLAGCAGIPADVDGTLRRAQDGELRVGITHNPPWTNTVNSAAPSGRDVRLVQEFADSLEANIVWTVGSESILTDQLHNGSLDVAIGGFTDDTPWTDRAAITAPFREERVDGNTKKHVLLTVLGENQFLTTLETFLLEHGDDQ